MNLITSKLNVREYVGKSSMLRSELSVSDHQLIHYLYQGYQIKAIQLDFVDTGSFYAFIVTTTENKKFFLKIYPHHQSLVPIPPSQESLTQMAITLQRLRNEFGLINCSYIISDATGHVSFTKDELTFILFEYIKGFHPSYSPNQLSADALAHLFFQLHHIPIQKFPELSHEDFDISVALGLKEWLLQKTETKDSPHNKAMLSRLKQNKQAKVNSWSRPTTGMEESLCAKQIALCTHPWGSSSLQYLTKLR